MLSKETRLFVWGGAAISGSGLFWSIPIANALTSIAAIAGLILIISRLGYTRAIVMSLAAIILSAMIGIALDSIDYGMISAGVFTIAVIAPGIAMGMASRSLSSPVKTILYGCIPIIILFALMLVFYTDLISGMTQIIRSTNASVVGRIEDNPGLAGMLSQRYGSDIEGREKFLEEIDSLVTFLIKIMPGMIMVGFLAIIVISLMLAGRVGAIMGVMIPRLRPFYLWRASEWWLLPTFAGLVLVIFGGIEFWRYFGGNILIVTGHVYAFSGLAYVESFFRRLAIPMFIRIVTYVLMLLISLPSIVFMAVLGLMDSRFNFRRENAEPGENNTE